MAKSNVLSGHTLAREGMAYIQQRSGQWVPAYRSWDGHGLCSCGEASGYLRSTNARKRWHREHKDEVRARGQVPVSLDIEHSEKPFHYGDGVWPVPLIRPHPWQEDWDEQIHGSRVEIPGELLARWQRIEAAFIAAQQELAEHARKAGQLD